MKRNFRQWIKQFRGGQGRLGKFTDWVLRNKHSIDFEDDRKIWIKYIRLHDFIWPHSYYMAFKTLWKLYELEKEERNGKSNNTNIADVNGGKCNDSEGSDATTGICSTTNDIGTGGDSD